MIMGTKVGFRPLQTSDLGLVVAWGNDLQHNSEYNAVGFQHAGQLGDYYKKNGLLDHRSGALLVVVCNTDEVIIGVSYHQVTYGPNEGSQAYNIGITFKPESRGKGYGSVAQQLFASYLFPTYTVMRVEASTDVTNLAGQRALEKLASHAKVQRERRSSVRASGVIS